jgi:hypothetical protein
LANIRQPLFRAGLANIMLDKRDAAFAGAF